MAWKPEFVSSVSMPIAFMIRTIIFYISYANSLFKFFIQIFYSDFLYTSLLRFLL